MINRNVDLLVIGAGAAGLAAAVKAYNKGIKRILVIDRESYPGGILRQCIHSGFGLEYYKDDLTGPEYLARMYRNLLHYNIPLLLNTNVIRIKPGPIAYCVSLKSGIQRIKSKAIILATGSYERTRENLIISGSRPAGVFTAGQAQQLINLYGYRIGKKVVIQGTGDIGLIITRRLILEGYEVISVYERLPFIAGLLRNKVQCLDDYDIEPVFNHQIIAIHGNSRVEGVTVAQISNIENGGIPIQGTEKYISCDTVVLSAGLIPNRQLLGSYKNSLIYENLATSLDGLFLAGNSVEIHDLADSASLQGELAADSVIEYFQNHYERITKKPFKAGLLKSRWSVPSVKTKSDDIVCIICPRGCILSEKNIRCKKGLEFLKQERQQKLRQITTTTWIKENNNKKRVAIRSKESHPFSLQSSMISKIKSNIKCINDLSLSDIGVIIND